MRLTGLSEIHARVYRNTVLGPDRVQDPSLAQQVTKKSTGGGTSGPSGPCHVADIVQSKSATPPPRESEDESF